MPDTPETVLAFDFGLRRIGVAVGQQVTESARPLGVVRNADAGPDWAHIGSLVAEWRPERLIVGMPRHADGSISELGDAVDRFVADLGRFGLPIETVDERYSSIDAQELLKSRRAAGLEGRIRKELIDAASAVLIAERWLKREL